MRWTEDDDGRRGYRWCNLRGSGGFSGSFQNLKESRQRGKVTYPLDEILLLCLFAVLAGAECFTEIALFRVKKRDSLR
jgi:hypothetical protein